MDLSFVRFYCLFGYCKPKACTTRTAIASLADPIERPEQIFQLILGYAASLIPNRDDGRTVLTLERDLNAASITRVSNRISQNVFNGAAYQLAATNYLAPIGMGDLYGFADGVRLKVSVRDNMFDQGP